MFDVLVVGAGPVGLTMASELARNGVRCRIVDRLAVPLPYCRAIGITPRTLEVWDDMGIAREMIDEGLWIDGLRSIIHGQPDSDKRLELSDLPYGELGLPQYETERLLTRHLHRLGLSVERGVALRTIQQDGSGVNVQLEKEGTIEQASFRYVVGCDGAHSTVRHAMGIGFEGEALPMTFMLGDVQIDWDLPRGMALRALRAVEAAAPHMFIAIPLPEPGRYRVSMVAPVKLASPGGSGHGIQSEARGPELDDIQAIADDLLPTRPRLTDLRWSSMFRISVRLADAYRRGRVFIAGDAAHIHPPTGGQGMNTGIQDAYNLAWKLALVLDGTAAERLLDSYEAERRPIGADVVARTRAASQYQSRDKGGAPDRLADTQILISYRGTDWVADDGVREAAGPAPGDRAPDIAGLRRHGVGFPIRLFDILRGTEHVLVVHLAGDAADLSAFARRLRADCLLPLRIVGIDNGEIPDHAGIALYSDPAQAFGKAFGGPGSAILVRPDGYVGWRGTSYRDHSLIEHITRLLR